MYALRYLVAIRSAMSPAQCRLQPIQTQPSTLSDATCRQKMQHGDNNS